jgi:hypothetical protein
VIDHSNFVSETVTFATYPAWYRGLIELAVLASWMVELVVAPLV